MATEGQGGFLLSRVHHLSARVFEKMLHDAGLENLTAARGRIIFALMQEDGIPQNALAARVRLDKSGLALTLRELEADGLVTRTRSSEDRRVCLVRRTELFESLQERFHLVSQRMNLLFYRGLSLEEIAVFEGTLERILENLDQDLTVT